MGGCLPGALLFLLTIPTSAPKRGFRDYPGFLNSTGKLGPKRGRKCYVTPAFSGVPNKGDKNRKPTLGVTMMPLSQSMGL